MKQRKTRQQMQVRYFSMEIYFSLLIFKNQIAYKLVTSKKLHFFFLLKV